MRFRLASLFSFLLLVGALPAFAIDAPAFSHPDVSIYQAHGGNFQANSRSDSSGNFFLYYEPVEIVQQVIEEVLTRTSWEARIAWTQKRALGADGFEALSPAAKLNYLQLLEVHRFPLLAWDGARSLILQRKRGAPEWLDEHPRMAHAPGAGIDATLSYEFPEVAVRLPAKSVRAALTRAEEVIRHTGLSDTLFSVVFDIDAVRLESQGTALFSYLQEVNDELFLEAAMRSVENIVNPEIRPWEAGHKVRAEGIIAERLATPYEHDLNDKYDPSGTYLGLKFLGMHEGKMRLSFELRGVEVDLGVDEFASSYTTRAKMNDARRYLDGVHSFAVSLVEGVAEDHHVSSRYLDPTHAKTLLEKHARLRKFRSIPRLETFARVVLDQENPEGILFPFSRPQETDNRAVDEYVTRLVELVVQTEDAVDDADLRRQLREDFWENYENFAQGELMRTRVHSLQWMKAALGPSCGLERLAVGY